MIMSEDVKNDLVENDMSSEEQLPEEQNELVEEEILDEDSSEESLEEGMHGKKKAKVDENDDEDEDEDDEEEMEESAPKYETPKTKAGVISAMVDMLKKARKDEAQKIYANVMKVALGDDEEASVKSADDAAGKVGKAVAPGAKAKVEAIDFEEDLDTIIAEEATLSDGFRGKAGAIFEAVLTSKLSQEIDRLESEYAQNLEEEVTSIQSDLVEKVNGYLDYVVENWMKENEVAVQQGLRTEIAEDFMTSLQGVFKEHYIEVPEGKVDLVDELNEQVAELEETLNKSTEDNISLTQAVQQFQRERIVREHSNGLAQTEAEKLSSLVEDIEFDNIESFEMKVKTVKESYFTKEVTESVDEVDSLIGEETIDESVSDTMARYTQAIAKFNK
jgi:hypothetical protein